MVLNAIRMSLRILRKNKVFSFINIAGMSVGLAGCLLIFLYVQNELSYDKFHKNRKNIYRVLMDQKWNPLFGITKINITPGGFAPRAKEDFPEIRNAARIMFSSGLIEVGGMSFNERGFWYVDPEFLDIFDFPLVKGDPKQALGEPFSILLTEEMCRKYFGDEDPIGKVLTINKNRYFAVTGILKDVPLGSHLQFNFLASFSTQYALEGTDDIETWRSNKYATYLLLHDSADPEHLAAKFPAFMEKHKPQSRDELFFLQPLAGIHLYSNDINTARSGDIKHIFFLSAVAFFIFLIACFNTMNLSTACASTRTREIGFLLFAFSSSCIRDRRRVPFDL